MRRATVTIPPDLEADLDRFLEAQAADPALAAIMAQALRRFLADPDLTPDRRRMVLRRRREIVKTARNHGVTSIRLFGSVARGSEDAESDLDFLVATEPGRSLFDLGRLRVALESILDAPVDLVTESNLTGDLRDEILAESILL